MLRRVEYALARRADTAHPCYSWYSRLEIYVRTMFTANSCKSRFRISVNTEWHCRAEPRPWAALAAGLVTEAITTRLERHRCSASQPPVDGIVYECRLGVRLFARCGGFVCSSLVGEPFHKGSALCQVGRS